MLLNQNIIKNSLGRLIVSLGLRNDSLFEIIVKNPQYLLAIFKLFKFYFKLEQLLDVIVIHYPEQKTFSINYIFLSITTNVRYRFIAQIKEKQTLQSITKLFPSANWLERELWDMFGIFFLNHPDLRRILTDYGFEGHPLRKDFPTVGYTEVRYDDEFKRVIVEPVNITQRFRVFDFQNPWENKI